MKIAVFGWYGHNNAGDERIKYCLSSFIKELGGINTIDFYDLHEEAMKGPTSRFDEYNLVIIGGGGLILSRHNYHDFILGINTKMVTLGISVETDLKGNPKRFAEALLEKSAFFLVRDYESYKKIKALDSKNKTSLSVDVTFLAPYDLLSCPGEKDSLAVNLFAKTKSHPIVQRIRNRLTRFSPSFLPPTFCFKSIIHELSRRYTLTPIPLFCEEKPENTPLFQSNDVTFLRQYFKNTPNTFNHGDLDGCAAFLSMRLHGLIFAAQKGIPFTTFSTYPKQKNFMKEAGLQNLCIDINQIDQTKEKLSMIDQNKDLIKETILIYRSKAVTQSKEDLTRVMNQVLK
jgi:polysaccharide pyruvyl transferase WcaK-like protein